MRPSNPSWSARTRAPSEHGVRDALLRVAALGHDEQCGEGLAASRGEPALVRGELSQQVPPVLGAAGVLEHIRKRRPDTFDTAILDECHQLKAKVSAQGIAAAGIAGCASRVIALTGTLFGAYSSTLFYLRYRFSRALEGEFGYHDEP